MGDKALDCPNVLETVLTDEQPLTVLILIWVRRVVPCCNIVSCIEDPLHVPDLRDIFLIVVVSVWADGFDEAPVRADFTRPLRPKMSIIKKAIRLILSYSVP